MSFCGAEKGCCSRGFTLVEILVVLSILVLLIGMLMPMLTKATNWAKDMKCMSNLHAIATAQEACIADHRALPAWDDGWHPCIHTSLDVFYERGYIKDRRAFYCPFDARPDVMMQQHSHKGGAWDYLYCPDPNYYGGDYSYASTPYWVDLTMLSGNAARQIAWGGAHWSYIHTVSSWYVEQMKAGNPRPPQNYPYWQSNEIAWRHPNWTAHFVMADGHLEKAQPPIDTHYMWTRTQDEPQDYWVAHYLRAGYPHEVLNPYTITRDQTGGFWKGWRNVRYKTGDQGDAGAASY